MAKETNAYSFDSLIENVTDWADNRMLLKKENASKQMLKVMEEVGETASALLKGDELKLIDGIGDSFVTLIILSKQLGLNPSVCLQVAWSEIKNRTGKTVDGTFIKD
jgi:NTP pyrophosphatase (non-canonical NTP hydrolase)